VAFGAIIAVFVAHSTYLQVVAEDAFIAFRFSSHLAGGHGLVWNLGDAPVEGYTDFLWILLCTGAMVLGIEVSLFAQVIGVLSGVVALFYTWRLAERVAGMPRPWSLLPGALLAVSGPFATWSTSGMETTLFAALAVAACYHGAAAWTSARALRGSVVAAVLLVLCALTRPEGVLVAGVFFAASAVLGRGGALRRDVVVPALIFAAAMVAYEWWRVAYFGQWLPNTYYAKVTGSFYRYLRGLIYAGAFFLYFVLPFVPMAALLVWRRTRATVRAEVLRAGTGVWLCAVMVVVYTAYIAWAGGDYMAMYRFFVPVLPFLYVLVAAALVAAIRRARAAATGTGRPVLLFAFGVLVTGIHSTPLDPRIFPKPPLQHGHFAGVQTERWHSARLSLIGDFFREHRRSPGESLATDAIGAIGYYSQMRVYDIHGLVDPHIAHERRRGEAEGLLVKPGHQRGDLKYILSKDPTYIMFDRRFTAEPGGYPGGVGPAVRELLERDFEPVSVWLDDAVNAESGYFTFCARRDQ
jgi:hypothetical protein